MALGIDDFYFALLILGTLLALIILWYVKAMSRHRREKNYLASPTAKKSFQTPFEMSSERDRREGARGSGRGPDSGSRGAVGGSNEASVGRAMAGGRETSGERRERKKRGKASRRETQGFDEGATGGGRGGATDSGRGGVSSGGGGGMESTGGRHNWASQDIVVKVNQKTGEEFTFFWGPGMVFSQWYPARFVLNGVAYNCAEQYMMHQKACLFGDEAIAKCILETEHPKEQKALGRQVQNFDLDLWNGNCKRIVREGNIGKFGQNPDLKDRLLATGNSTLVEASPYDCIWGIGLASDNPKAIDRKKWRGTNWLGVVLSQVRDEIRASLDSH